MNLDEARKTLTDSVLHIGETDYPADKQDRALKFALQRFMRQTRCTTITSGFSFTPFMSHQNIATTISDFLPSQVVRCRILYKPVALVNVGEVMRYLDESSTNGQPEMIAWEDPDSALVWPIPDLAYSLLINRTVPLIDWDLGTVDEVELNIPEQFVRDAIWFGAGPALVYGEGGSLYASEGWRQFEKLIDEVKGLATMETGSNWKAGHGRPADQSNIEGGRAASFF